MTEVVEVGRVPYGTKYKGFQASCWHFVTNATVGHLYTTCGPGLSKAIVLFCATYDGSKVAAIAIPQKTRIRIILTMSEELNSFMLLFF